jgi:general secretion pathway protein D
MKTHTTLSITTGLLLSFRIFAAEQPPGAGAKDAPATPTATNVTSAAASDATNPAPTNAAPPSEAAAAPDTAAPATGKSDGLRLNFRGAPLSLVLDYLSDAAGFVINKEADVRGTVDVWSKGPLSKDEAVELLNQVLKKNGCAVTRNGRILTIVPMDTAKTSDLEVMTGSDYQSIEKSAEVVTQIIPVRYANATQLMNNLQVLLPMSASLSANESANTLILVATKTDIRRILKIVNALDTSIANVSSIKVFQLQFADAKQLATEITQLFTPQASNQGPGGNNPRAQLFNMFRGGGGFGGPGGPGGGGAANGAGNGSGGGGAGSKVVAAADEYSNALIVLASAELLATISDMVQQIDKQTNDDVDLRVFKLANADPTELADQLATLYPDPTTAAGQQNNMPFFMRGPGGGGRNNTTASDRSRKLGRVVAVPDPRTSALIVTASKTLMPQISEMIAELDSAKGKKEIVGYFELQNADPQDIQQSLQDLFHRSNIQMQNNNNRNSMLGQNNPLTQRQTQIQQPNSGISSFGSSTGSRSSGGF